MLRLLTARACPRRRWTAGARRSTGAGRCGRAGSRRSRGTTAARPCSRSAFRPPWPASSVQTLWVRVSGWRGVDTAAAAGQWLTRPEAEEILGIACFDGAHGAVLDAHNGPFCVQRHRVCGCGCGVGGVCWWVGGVVTVRVRLRQRRRQPSKTRAGVITVVSNASRECCKASVGGWGEVEVPRARWMCRRSR